MGSTMWGRRWLIALSRNFICIVTGRGGLQCPCSKAIVTMYCRVYISIAKACILKRACVHGDGDRWTRSGICEMGWRIGNNGAKVPSPKMYEGALDAWNLIVMEGGGCSSFFSLFSLHASEKGGGEGREVVALLLCWVPGLLLQYRTQYSDHLASQGALWSLQWCQGEKRATPSRLARRWLPAHSECWSAVSSFDRNPLWTGWWAGGLLFCFDISRYV